MSKDTINLDIQFFYYFAEAKMKQILQDFKKKGLGVKVYIIDLMKIKEGEELYTMLERTGVDVLITDEVSKVLQFNSQEKK